MKHRLTLDDVQLVIVREALLELQRVSDADIAVNIVPILVKIKDSWDAKALQEKTVRIPRSKEDMAREAILDHIDVLFDPASRAEAAKDFRERFLDGRDDEIPELKAGMVKDAKKFPKPTDEAWEWNGEKPSYAGKDWHPWYGGRIGGLWCEVSFNTKLTKVTRVYIEVD